MFRRVHVTTHALERWRERAATYGDASEKEIVEAVNKARLVTKEEPLPFVREENTHYYQIVEEDLWFICEPVERDIIRIVTIFIRDYPKPILTPKVKVRKRNKLEIPTFNDIGEERIWLKNKLEEIVQEFKYGPSVLRDQVIEDQNVIHKRLSETKWYAKKLQLERNLAKRRLQNKNTEVDTV